MMLCKFPYRESPLSLYLAPHAITPSTGLIEKKLSTYFGPCRTKLVGVFVALYQVWKEVKDVGWLFESTEGESGGTTKATALARIRKLSNLSQGQVKGNQAVFICPRELTVKALVYTCTCTCISSHIPHFLAFIIQYIVHELTCPQIGLQCQHTE